MDGTESMHTLQENLFQTARTPEQILLEEEAANWWRNCLQVTVMGIHNGANSSDHSTSKIHL